MTDLGELYAMPFFEFFQLRPINTWVSNDGKPGKHIRGSF